MVWGRGALDMKSGVAMIVHAFIRAHADGPPPGDLVLAVLSDEENGGDFGARFLVEEHAELFEGIRHALGEFGGATVHLGGRSFYPIQVAEKQICWLRGVVRGPGGHAAIGVRGSAMGKLGVVLREARPPQAADPRHAGCARVDRGHGGRAAAAASAAPPLAARPAARRDDVPRRAHRAAAPDRARAAEHGDRDDRPRRREDQRHPVRRSSSRSTAARSPASGRRS